MLSNICNQNISFRFNHTENIQPTPRVEPENSACKARVHPVLYEPLKRRKWLTDFRQQTHTFL